MHTFAIQYRKVSLVVVLVSDGSPEPHTSGLEGRTKAGSGEFSSVLMRNSFNPADS